MTARGRKRRTADASPRDVAARRPTLPETRLPLRNTVNGYQMRHVDVTGAERLSLRTWDKGSARGEGPQQRREGVAVAASAPWVPCEDCPSLRPATAAGRHGAMPVSGATLAASWAHGSSCWLECRHGVPYWENCAGRAVPPPCCLDGAP